MKRKFLLGKAEKVQSAELSRAFHIPNKNYGILLFQTLLLENFFSFLTFSSPLFLIFWVAKENPKNAIFFSLKNPTSSVPAQNTICIRSTACSKANFTLFISAFACPKNSKDCNCPQSPSCSIGECSFQIKVTNKR